MTTKEELKGDQKEISFPEGGIHSRVVKGVLKALDQKRDWAVNRAIEEFLETFQRKFRERGEVEILKQVSSKETMEAIIRFHLAILESLVLQIRLGHADQKCRIASDNLMLTVEEYEAVDLKGDWEIDAFNGLTVKRRNDKEQAAFQKIFEFVKSMADGKSSVPLASVCKGILPEEIKKVAGQMRGTKITEFFIDIANLMEENGEKGRRLVLQICDDVQFAEQAIREEDTPPPLRFLASTVLEFIKKPN